MTRGARRPVAAFLALALCGGCSRDLEIPTFVPPSVTGVTPSRAYSGQVITVLGSGFEDDPEANVVVFTGATARAFARTAAGIQVRVPLDAGSGPVGVTSSRGTSSATVDFTYLGAGQLRLGQVAARTALVHEPRRAWSAAGAIYLDSQLASGVVQLDDPTFFLPGGARQVPVLGGGAFYSVDLYDPAQPTGVVLRRHHLASGAEASRAFPMDQFDNIGHVVRTGGDRLVGLGPSPGSPSQLSAWLMDPLTLADLREAIPLPWYLSSAPLDAGGARLLAVVMPTPRTPLALGLLELAAALPVSRTIGAAGHAFDPSTVALGTGPGPLGPGQPSGNRQLAAVGLSNGDVAIADLDAVPPAFVGAEIETRSPSPIEALLFTGDGQLLATKPDDDILLGIDLATRRVVWSVPMPAPTRMTLADGLVYVANRTDAPLAILDPATHQQLGAVRADVGPGAADGHGGLVFEPAGAGGPLLILDALYMVTTHPAKVLRYGLGDVYPIPAATSFVPGFVMRNPYDDVVWAAGPGEVGPVDVPDVYPLPGRPVRTAFTEGYLAVGTDVGLSLVQAGIIGGETWDGPTLPRPVFKDVGFLPSGALYATLTMDDTARAVRRDAVIGFTLDELRAGVTPLHGTWVSDETGLGEITGSALLEDGLWVFFTADPWTFEWQAALLDPAWAASGTWRILDLVPAPEITHAVVSPNRRTFCHWKLPFRGGTDLHLRSADPSTRFQELAFHHLEGVLTGLTYDASGERVYVLTRNPDQLITLE